LKNTLERQTIDYLQNKINFSLLEKKVLMVCALDRFGMAQSLADLGCQTIYGDLMFALGLPIPIRKLQTLERLAKMVVPVLSWLPIKYLYPIGKEQEKITASYEQYYQWADVITGDFHFIKKHLPEKIDGKIIITNTVTNNDVKLLKERGVKYLITTTPNLAGRSFGTNVMEGVLVALSGKKPEELTTEYYAEMLKKIQFQPRVESFIG